MASGFAHALSEIPVTEHSGDTAAFSGSENAPLQNVPNVFWPLTASTCAQGAKKLLVHQHVNNCYRDSAFGAGASSPYR